MRELLHIDGKWVAPVAGGTIPAIDPATGQVFQRVAAATAPDIDVAVQAARNAFERGPWPRMTGKARAAILHAIAAMIKSRLKELAALETKDNGKPLPEAEWDVADASGCFSYYARLGEGLDDNRAESIDLPDARFVSEAVREPVGVCAAIVPWNYPLLMAAWKVAPALAAGCTVVLKPSELTSLTALELAEIAHQCGLPDGALNVVTGTGVEAGQALADNPGVDKVAFTGSEATGTRVMAAAARGIKRVSLELGGKSAFIVFDDASIEAAVEWIMFGVFWNQGQVCSATSRVLIQDRIFEPVLERLLAETRAIRIGPGTAPGVLLGPLVSEQQLDRVSRYVEIARADGATIRCGGRRASGLGPGYFFEPTVLTDVPLHSAAWREEIFGPVVCVHRFRDEREAVGLANDTPYGLAAAVMSADQRRAERVAGALRAGIVWINCSQPTFTEAPWGGFKRSGIGRELGRWGLEAYLEVKQITRYVTAEPWGWYIKPHA